MAADRYYIFDITIYGIILITSLQRPKKDYIIFQEVMKVYLYKDLDKKVT